MAGCVATAMDENQQACRSERRSDVRAAEVVALRHATVSLVDGSVLSGSSIASPARCDHHSMAIVRVGAIADMETEDEIRARYQRWSKLARKEDAQVPDLSPSEITAEIV